MPDARFDRLQSDPRFRRPKKHAHKVVVDARFKSVLGGSSKKRDHGGRVDKYGRAVAKDAARDDLRRFYRLEGDEDGAGAEGDDDAAAPDYARGAVLLESSDEDDAEDDEDEDDDGPVTLGHDRTRPIRVEELEVALDETDFADLDAQAAAAAAAQAAEDAAPPVRRTRRLAAVNLDWDHVRAAHLHKIFASIAGGAAKDGSASLGRLFCVKVYPSAFGKARMAREEVEGPPADVFRTRRELDPDEVTAETVYDVGDEGEVDDDALRTYQLERMRYYYAIAEFDSEATAARVYEELEGAELERSANVFDLSYVPDDMSFDDEPRDEASTEAGTYRGLDFVTDALRHSKVKLHWDEDDPARDRITRRALTKAEVEAEDFGALVASSGSESEGDGEGARERMRALLLGGDDADALPEGWGAHDSKAGRGARDVEITFTPALSGRVDDPDNETTLERYQRRMRDKRKARKDAHEKKTKAAPAAGSEVPVQDEFFAVASESDGEAAPPPPKGRKAKKTKEKEKEAPAPRTVSTAAELALLAAPDAAGADARHFDMKAIVKAEKKRRGKGRKKDKKSAEDGPDELQADFAVDVRDERFSAMHEDHAFAIDPSNPYFKKTKSMSALLDERAKRRKREDGGAPAAHAAAADVPADSAKSLERLVESVKRKGLAHAEGAGAGKRRRT